MRPLMVCGLNPALIDCYTKVKEFSLPYYLPITRGRIVRSVPLQEVLLLCEMQTASSEI